MRTYRRCHSPSQWHDFEKRGFPWLRVRAPFSQVLVHWEWNRRTSRWTGLERNCHIVFQRNGKLLMHIKSPTSVTFMVLRCRMRGARHFQVSVSWGLELGWSTTRTATTFFLLLLKGQVGCCFSYSVILRGLFTELRPSFYLHDLCDSFWVVIVIEKTIRWRQRNHLVIAVGFLYTLDSKARGVSWRR